MDELVECRFHGGAHGGQYHQLVDWDGGWPDVDLVRFEVEPRHLFGPFWTLRIYDRVREVEVFQSAAVLTGRSSVRRSAKYATKRYLLRDAGGKHEPGSRRPGY
jgi:hypothetical protein